MIDSILFEWAEKYAELLADLERKREAVNDAKTALDKAASAEMDLRIRIMTALDKDDFYRRIIALSGDRVLVVQHREGLSIEPLEKPPTS